MAQVMRGGWLKGLLGRGGTDEAQSKTLALNGKLLIAVNPRFFIQFILFTQLLFMSFSRHSLLLNFMSYLHLMSSFETLPLS